MLILTDAPRTRVTSCAGRLARSEVYFLDARGLAMEAAAVRNHLGDTERTWLITVPDGLSFESAAQRFRRPRERVLRATALNAGDLGTLMSDATEVLDAAPPAPRIDTPRTQLTFPDAAQIDGFYTDIVGTSMFETLIWDGPKDADEIHDTWHRWRQIALDGPRAALSLAVIENATHRYVGGVSIRPKTRGAGQFDIGYALAPRVHGRGLGTEVVQAVCDEIFRHRGGERIEATVFVGNHASRRVAEKAGFICEGTLRSALRKGGTLRDEWMMALTRTDWIAHRS